MCRCRWLRAVSSRVHWPVESIGQSESKGISLADITAFGSVVLSTHQTRHSILLERNLPLKASSNSVGMHHLCSLKKATCCKRVTCQSLKGSLNPIKTLLVSRHFLQKVNLVSVAQQTAISTGCATKCTLPQCSTCLGAHEANQQRQ